jgi:coatomer subunit beta'
VAVGFDEGMVVLKMGREEPAMSMDSSGKIIYAKHMDIVTTQIKGVGKRHDSFNRNLTYSFLFR